MVATVESTTMSPSGLGRLCLNFVATVADRRDAARERLETRPDLARWLEDAGLVDHAVKLKQADLTQAQALREAIYRLVTGEGHPDHADVDLVNQWARHHPPVPVLSSDGSQRESDAKQSFSAALSLIARDAIDLLSSPARRRVRTCADEACGAPFLDTSRPGKRRWCYMGRCGNRAKKSRHRARQPQPTPSH